MNGGEFVVRAGLKARRHLHDWAARLGRRQPCEYLWMNGRELRVWHRGVQADVDAIAQNLWHRHYDILPLRGAAAEATDAFHAATLRDGARPLIVDAGAHIGSSALWFATRYPGARIIAIEPSPDNFALLRRNTDGYGVQCVEAGLGGTGGTAHLTQAGQDTWAFRTLPDAAGPSVAILSLADIVARHGGDGSKPFILKIDIEGAEAGLFDADPAAFAAFPVIIVELHDWMLPREGTSRSFLDFHLRHGRDLLSRGENVFSIDYGALAGTR